MSENDNAVIIGSGLSVQYFVVLTDIHGIEATQVPVLTLRQREPLPKPPKVLHKHLVRNRPR